ncbi:MULTISPECIES: hypothetical protein [unclassified Caballeronia]|uniref:hypothetical protein n=1 Tax=unclassified Caballeronia TaxID=2646786 RepID=UPI00285FA587|nr:MULTISPECIES: hypothetical protein [unclassified Caballeronia]MDR5751053.1 hypothetical protein [Caballeronia sp. LZ024]MDR5844812.1 hypothetical protein [Caballeronia sp. LZ031]
MIDFGMSYGAATAYVERYNDMVDQVNAVAARYANAAASSLTNAASDLAEADTSFGNTADSDGEGVLGDAQPFEYGEDLPEGDDESLAGMPIKGGPPNTWVLNPSGSGQLRLYDANGNAATDIDFDHDHGFGAPHSHNWDGQDRDLGNPVSILP